MPSILPRSSESSRGVRRSCSRRDFVKRWRGTSRTTRGSIAFAAARTAANGSALGPSYEGDRSGGRIGNAALSHYAGGEQAAVAGVRQADDPVSYTHLRAHE